MPIRIYFIQFRKENGINVYSHRLTAERSPQLNDDRFISTNLEFQGDSFTSVLRYMSDALEFLLRNVGRGNESGDIDSRTDKIKMMAIH
jgi:hypothetical protein